MTDISALEAYAGQLSEAATLANASAQTQRQIVNGDALTDVLTESGPVPTLAKQAVLAQAKVTASLTEVASQMAGAMTYATTAAGLAGTGNDGYFSTPSADDGEYLVLYKNENGTAGYVNTYPSAALVRARFRDGRGPAYAKHGDNYGYNRWLAYDDGSFGTHEAYLGPDGVRLSTFDLESDESNALAVRDAYGYYSVRVKAGSDALPQFPGFQVLEDVAKGMEGVAIEKASKVLAVRDANGYYAMSLTPESFAAKGAGVNEAGAGEEQVKTAMNLIRDTRSRSGLRKMQVAAHRGFISQAPQNTLMAFSTALQRGADVLELDVKFSSDDVAYVFHDLTVDALTSGTGSFRSLTAAQIDALTFKQLSGTIFEQGVRIPRFSEYLQWAREESAYSLVELKDLPTIAHADTLLQLIDDAQMLELTTIASINFSELAYVRSRYTDVPLSWLVSATDYVSKVLTAAPLAPAELSADAPSLQANPGIVRSAKAAGLGISAWGVNTLAAAKRLERLGVNSIISDVSLRVDS
ncbi:glycerophosphodiester phosphodiesterase [Pseudomonas fluorescens]|uniref:GP-PDE domain-containing protein n=1 Tax=Pseudomonas fluorescens TaxID=294 RepID=A0A5E7AIK1_PSEFL|nr:glycerophosphodiester phosphodiesterase family protein [Pseudomonas fluorescens]VVN76474.1 hypothetical protein PS833_00768 [Pseudomonas fluorescens]